MALGVFIHRSDSIYQDSPAEQYQFPGQYLGRVRDCIGSWIIYLEPSKVRNTRGYFAIAKILDVIPDVTAPGMHLALIEPGSYLDFINPVPFSGKEGIVERGLLNDQGAISGRAQSAVRPIAPSDFNRIVDIGLADSEVVLPRIGDAIPFGGFSEPQAPFEYGLERDRIGYVGSRVVRDRVFRQIVLRAYDERCAITSLKLINGGGRAEVDAAHIRSVEANGPDIINNGLALSGTAHWMFDRGLIGLSDDLEILISRQVNDADAVRAIINKSGRALLPSRVLDRPHPRFLQWHRDHCFKQ